MVGAGAGDLDGDAGLLGEGVEELVVALIVPVGVEVEDGLFLARGGGGVGGGGAGVGLFSAGGSQEQGRSEQEEAREDAIEIRSHH